ncbi:MAG: hypothetical protein VB099_16390 [Candidatus Limiplasma sp.]|nr:hypothetical protein [Candidatus Limiplasma sp.]
MLNTNKTTWKAKEPNPAKRYLAEYRTLACRRDTLIEELERLRDASMRATSRLSATRLSGTSGRGGMEDSVIRVVDGEEALRRTIAHLDECLVARLVLIERLTDERQKLVLTYRYINGWGWAEIMRRMCLSERPMFYLHGKALESFRRAMKNQQ